MEKFLDNRKIFIKGKTINLVCLDKEDVENTRWYGWFNDRNVTKFLQKGYFPSTIHSQMAFFDNNLRNSTDLLQLGIVNKSSSKLLGVVSLSNIDFINRHAEISLVIGEPEGRDFSTSVEAWRLIFWHGFNVLNLNRIYGGSISQDVVNMMCRFACCKAEGVRRQEVFKNGFYHDTYLYGVLKTDFNALFGAFLE